MATCYLQPVFKANIKCNLLYYTGHTIYTLGISFGRPPVI